MNSNSRKHLIPIIAIIIAANTVFAAAMLSRYGFRPSAFIQQDVLYFNRYKPMFKHEMVVVTGGYDAMFYYLAASNINGKGLFRKQYFQHRILLPVMIYAGALGDQGRFPWSFFLSALAGTVLSGVSLAEYFRRRGISPWASLWIVLFPGMVINTLHAGVDGLSLGLGVLGLLLCGDDRPSGAGRTALGLVCLLFAALAKETGAMFSVALFLGSLLRGRGRAGLIYLLPVAGYFGWTAICDKFFIIGGDYGTKEALAYNYSAVPFAGIAAWLRETLTQAHGAALITDVAAPLGFFAFCAFTAAAAIPRIRTAGSVFLPISVILMTMFIFTKSPMLNLYSCLRVYLPIVVCFVIVVNSFRPRLRLALTAGFAAFVIAADLLILFKSVQEFFIYIPK